MCLCNALFASQNLCIYFFTNTAVIIYMMFVHIKMLVFCLFLSVWRVSGFFLFLLHNYVFDIRYGLIPVLFFSIDEIRILIYHWGFYCDRKEELLT